MNEPLSVVALTLLVSDKLELCAAGHVHPGPTLRRLGAVQDAAKRAKCLSMAEAPGKHAVAMRGLRTSLLAWANDLDREERNRQEKVNATARRIANDEMARQGAAERRQSRPEVRRTRVERDTCADVISATSADGCLDAAAGARDVAALEHFGARAVLNLALRLRQQ